MRRESTKHSDAKSVGGVDLRRRSARVASAARRLNRDPRLLTAVRRARERLLGDDELTRRLASSRHRPADIAARELVVLRGESPGALGELGLVALQAWQSFAEHRGRGRGDVEIAIMFTDLVGYSAWALEAGDEAAITLLGEVSDAIEPPIGRRKGEVVKRLGDGLMAVFWDVSTATEAAFEARARVEAIAVSGYRPRLRTGIHLGRPRKIGRDYLGVDVNVAARLAQAARAGEVLVSERALVAVGDTDMGATKRDLHAKGVPASLVAYALSPSVQTASI
jgi:adenylate cyclase